MYLWSEFAFTLLLVASETGKTSVVSIQGLTRRVPPLPCSLRRSLQRLFLEVMLDTIFSDSAKQASRQPKPYGGIQSLRQVGLSRRFLSYYPVASSVPFQRRKPCRVM